MKDNQEYSNGRQLHIEDYLQENKLETEGNVEVPSIFVVSLEKEVDRPWRIKYIGFSFYQAKGKVEIRIHPKSVAKFKDKVRAITSRSNAMSMESRCIKLKQTIVGWVNYFKIANMQKIAQKLDEWIRRRIRMCYWKQWKKIKTKHDNLVKLGINNYKTWEYANTRKSYWRISDTPFLHQALNNKMLVKLGYTSLTSVYC